MRNLTCDMSKTVREKMTAAKKLKSPKEPSQLNPNWAQLRQKLQSGGPKRTSQKSESDTPKSILGKRKERSNEESNAPLPNKLIPSSSDFSVTNVIAMDCEMVGVGPLGNKSALARVTLVNQWGNIIYDEYVRPVEHVVNFRTEISGIRPRDLRKAKDFNSVQKKVAELIKGRILIGHALRNDLKALLLSHPKKDLRDTSEYQAFLKEGRSRALRLLAAEVLGIEIQNGEHCPIEDARAAMQLYQKYRREWERSIKDYIRLKKKQKQRKHKKKPQGAEGSNVKNVVTT